ncbi:MAG: hypothetical protein LBR51_04165 [Bacteroidales bacterium]|jgi:hypothetical protein|nr:hypothetical protein [Bacteroidales bacterium]
MKVLTPELDKSRETLVNYGCGYAAMESPRRKVFSPRAFNETLTSSVDCYADQVSINSHVFCFFFTTLIFHTILYLDMIIFV